MSPVKELDLKYINFSASELENHYQKCKNVILSYCKEGDTFRALIGDHKIWWKTNREKNTAKLFYPNTEDYDLLTSKYRTLYWTAQLFTPDTANIEKEYDFEKHRITEQIGSREDTIFHSFFLDFDKAKGRDIHDPEVLEWLEKGIKFFADKLLVAGVKSFGLAFSGGGCYCVLHPRLGMIDEDEKNRAYKIEIIQAAFDLFIGDIAAEFFEKNQEAIAIVKFDKLNYDKKRQVKTILSIHKKYPYAVIPLDKHNPKINLEEASLPISDEIIEKAKGWFSYQDDIDNFGNLIAPWLEKAKGSIQKKHGKRTVTLEESEVAETEWAPCIRNLLDRKDLKSGEGGTRALAVLASYMRYVGVPEEKAYNIFHRKADEWNAETSNIFESWYGCEHLDKPTCFVPSCEKMQAKGGGYPHPKLGDLDICTPTERCKEIRSPVQYHKKREDKKKSAIPLKYNDNDFGTLTLEKCGNDVAISIKKEGADAPIIPKELKPYNFCVRPKIRDYVFSHVKKELPEDEYKRFLEAITPQIENALKSKKEKETKEETQKKNEAAFNVLDSIENAVENATKTKYHGTINFNPYLGVFFTVPWNIPPIFIYDDDDKIVEVRESLYKPILCTPREGFAHKIDEDKKSEIMKHLPAQPQQIIEVFAQYSEVIEGVPLYLSANQDVQILKSYLTLLETGENECEKNIEEIGTHLYTKHIRYFKYVDDIEHYIVACWAIGTYLFPMFSVFPFLIHIGEKGTNKSGSLEFLSRVCWNPTAKLSLPGEAPLFRLMHLAKPTQLIDEVHRLLNDPIRGPVLQALLETGHEQGGCVPRCDPNDYNKINFYNTYCPKALVSRESLEIEEKGISIIIEKTLDKRYAIARKNIENDPDLEIIRSGLLNLALSRWSDIYHFYQTIEPTPKLAGRYFVLWSPILAICKNVYPDKYIDMIGYAEKAAAGAQKKSYEVEIAVLSWLATHLTDIENNGNAIFFKDIKDALNLKWQAIYSALRNFGLIKMDRDTKQGKKYYLHVDKIEKLAEERSITTEEASEEKEVCDKCGEDTLTSEYNGMQVCPECKEELMKTEPQKNLFPKNHEKTKRKESEEQEKEAKPEETEEENKKELICICGKRFDTIEVLHTHQAKCKEFQQKQDREAVQ